MKIGRSFDPALDLPVPTMSHPSLNFGDGGQVISSKDGSLLIVVGRCKALTLPAIVSINWYSRIYRIFACSCV